MIGHDILTVLLETYWDARRLSMTCRSLAALSRRLDPGRFAVISSWSHDDASASLSALPNGQYHGTVTLHAKGSVRLVYKFNRLQRVYHRWANESDELSQEMPGSRYTPHITVAYGAKWTMTCVYWIAGEMIGPVNAPTFIYASGQEYAAVTPWIDRAYQPGAQLRCQVPIGIFDDIDSAIAYYRKNRSLIDALCRTDCKVLTSRPITINGELQHVVDRLRLPGLWGANSLEHVERESMRCWREKNMF